MMELSIIFFLVMGCSWGQLNFFTITPNLQALIKNFNPTETVSMLPDTANIIPTDYTPIDLENAAKNARIKTLVYLGATYVLAQGCQANIISYSDFGDFENSYNFNTQYETSSAYEQKVSEGTNYFINLKVNSVRDYYVNITLEINYNDSSNAWQMLSFSYSVDYLSEVGILFHTEVDWEGEKEGRYNIYITNSTGSQQHLANLSLTQYLALRGYALIDTKEVDTDPELEYLMDFGLEIVLYEGFYLSFITEYDHFNIVQIYSIYKLDENDVSLFRFDIEIENGLNETARVNYEVSMYETSYRNETILTSYGFNNVFKYRGNWPADPIMPDYTPINLADVVNDVTFQALVLIGTNYVIAQANQANLLHYDVYDLNETYSAYEQKVSGGTNYLINLKLNVTKSKYVNVKLGINYDESSHSMQMLSFYYSSYELFQFQGNNLFLTEVDWEGEKEGRHNILITNSNGLQQHFPNISLTKYLTLGGYAPIEVWIITSDLELMYLMLFGLEIVVHKGYSMSFLAEEGGTYSMTQIYSIYKKVENDISLFRFEVEIKNDLNETARVNYEVYRKPATNETIVLSYGFNNVVLNQKTSSTPLIENDIPNSLPANDLPDSVAFANDLPASVAAIINDVNDNYSLNGSGCIYSNSCE